MNQNNSECTAGFLHSYKITKTLPHGIIERCTRCLDTQFFRNEVPNYIYLSFHVRSALQMDHKRFIKEYGQR